MRSVILARNACLVIAAVGLALAFLPRHQGWIIAAIALLPVVWLIMRRHSYVSRSSTLLVACVGLAVAGVVLGMSFLLLVLAVAAALAAWDLANFAQTLALAARPVDLWRLHLRALLIAATSGILLALASVTVSLNLPFTVIAVLSLILALALAWFVQELRRIRD